MSLTASPAPFPGFHCVQSGLPKGEAERRETHCLTRAAQRGARSTERARLSASHCGSRQGDSWSPRLCIRPCFGRQSGAFSPVRPFQPGSGDLAPFHGHYPRRKNERNCLRTASTSHTGPSAGTMMPDAARERVTSPPAGTALAPSQGVSSRRTSLRKARWSLLVRGVGWIQEIPRACAISLIQQRIISRCLFDSRPGNCGNAAMMLLFVANPRTRLRFLDSRGLAVLLTHGEINPDQQVARIE
jgi:hypothetical protein